MFTFIWVHNMISKVKIRVFVDHGAKVNQALTKLGETPAHAAAQLGHARCLRTLHQLGADLNAKDKNGLGVLGRATLNNYPDVVSVLLVGTGHADVNGGAEEGEDAGEQEHSRDDGSGLAHA